MKENRFWGFFLAVFLAVFLCGLAAQTWAQDVSRAKITKKHCSRLVGYVQPPGVAYEPGVDVHGKKVAPAGIGGAQIIKPPEEFSFDLNYNLAGKVPGAAGNVYEPNFKLGTITVKKGVPYFDGKPLTDEDQSRQSEACQKQGF